MSVSDWADVGSPRDPATDADLRACEEVANAFAELLDEGDLETAFSRHTDDVAFWGPGAEKPTGKQGAIEGAAAVRYAYPGRRTLHLVSNFLARPRADGTVEARYALTVYELTERVDGETRALATPRVFALAHEHAVFRREPGGWRLRGAPARAGRISPGPGAGPMNHGDVLGDPLARSAPASLAGRTALVAGGGLAGPDGSIGFSTSWLLAREGARVVIADRDPDAAERAVELITAEGGTASSVIGDVADDAACRELVAEAHARHGVLDALVTTVGRGDLDGVLEVDRPHWDEILEVNLTSAWQLIRYVAPLLPRGSSIVTTSSGAAAARGPATPYGIAKAALEQLTVGSAATLAPHGIRVNAVRVGTIWSSFAARAFSAEVREQRRELVALRTEGNVWDVASAVAFLSGDRARWITGQVLTVDGGGPTPAPPGHRQAAAEEESTR